MTSTHVCVKLQIPLAISKHTKTLNMHTLAHENHITIATLDSEESWFCWDDKWSIWLLMFVHYELVSRMITFSHINGSKVYGRFYRPLITQTTDACVNCKNCKYNFTNKFDPKDHHSMYFHLYLMGLYLCMGHHSFTLHNFILCSSVALQLLSLHSTDYISYMLCCWFWWLTFYPFIFDC